MNELSFEDLDKSLLNSNGKIIHQIWFGLIPNKRAAKKQFEKLKKYRDSWVTNNPNWLYYCWNYENCEKLIKTYYPQHLEMYKKYPYLIQKCDAVRYFILDRYGGLYADMDYECIKSFDLVFEKYIGDIYLVETPNKLGSDIHISNSLMYSKTSNNIFWKKLFIELEKNQKAPIYYGRHLTIMFTTGPAILNKVFNKYKLTLRLDYFPYRYFHPAGLTDNISINDRQELYAMHKGAGSWESADSKILIFFYQEYRIISVIILCLLFSYFLPRFYKKS